MAFFNSAVDVLQTLVAVALKAERSDTDRDTDKKPSIREQLKQASADLTQRDSPAPSRTKEKSPGLEV